MQNILTLTSSKLSVYGSTGPWTQCSLHDLAQREVQAGCWARTLLRGRTTSSPNTSPRPAPTWQGCHPLSRVLHVNSCTQPLVGQLRSNYTRHTPLVTALEQLIQATSKTSSLTSMSIIFNKHEHCCKRINSCSKRLQFATCQTARSLQGSTFITVVPTKTPPGRSTLAISLICTQFRACKGSGSASLHHWHDEG